MDSLLILAQAYERGDEVYPLFFQYGQKTQSKEQECFDKICEHYKIPKERQLIIDLNVLRSIGGSSLTDASLPVGVELKSKEIPQSYVPFRNSIFLSCAVSWAEVLRADNIIIGAVLEDAPGYPDCRPEYYWAFQELIKRGAGHNKILIQTPIIRMSKEDILKSCFSLNAPIEYTWSCYKSIEVPCLQCDSCLLRKNAFTLVDKEDTLR